MRISSACLRTVSVKCVATNVEVSPLPEGQGGDRLLSEFKRIFDEDTGDGAERQLGAGARRHRRVHQDVRDARPQRGQLVVAEVRPGVVAAGQVTHGVEAVDRGRREVGVPPLDAGHLVVQVLERASLLDPAAQLSTVFDVLPHRADESVAALFTREATLQIRVEAFNVTNTPKDATPVMNASKYSSTCRHRL